MPKLKDIIKQLSEKDFKEIYDSLVESNSEKSIYLMKAMREKELVDSKMIAELEVNANAYYTLRSRLHQKIEEHLLQQMESPRTDILRKVANINEVLFTKKKTISIATLKKLEKELLDYDLASELTVVYKSLKKLHINSPEHFQYSQLYNRHVAYMLAVDKAENLLTDYFKKYGSYHLSGGEMEKLGLTLLLKEIQSVAKLYESHRLYVYQSLMLIFHRLFVESDDSLQQEGEAIEDIFAHIRKIFEAYSLDPLYFHLNLVFEFLKLEYYNHYKVYRQAEKYFEEVNDAAPNLLVNYTYLTFPIQFFISKLQRSLRLGTERELCAENERVFADIEEDPMDAPAHVIYVVYRALGYYYSEKYEEAAKWINNLLNEVAFKKYPFAQVEIKALLALLYCLIGDIELFKGQFGSVTRQIRTFEKEEECANVVVFLKMLRIATSESKTEKPRKIAALIPKFNEARVTYFSPTALVKMDDVFVKKLTAIETEND
jgi:hypothetical protein